MLLYFLSTIVLSFSFQFETFDTSVYLSQDTSSLLLKSKEDECLQKAVLKLVSGCRNIEEELQIKVAFEFMNCFFQQTGHEEFICLEDPKDCTEKLPNEIYAIYSKFYIHAQSVCFYAKSALWSSKVDELINSLVQTSDGLVQTAKITLERTNSLLLAQEQIEHLLGVENTFTVKIEKQLEEASMKLLATKTLAEVGFDEIVEQVNNQTSVLTELLSKLEDDLNFIRALGLTLKHLTEYHGVLFYFWLFMILQIVALHPAFSGLFIYLANIMFFLIEEGLTRSFVEDLHLTIIILHRWIICLALFLFIRRRVSFRMATKYKRELEE